MQISGQRAPLSKAAAGRPAAAGGHRNSGTPRLRSGGGGSGPAHSEALSGPRAPLLRYQLSAIAIGLATAFCLLVGSASAKEIHTFGTSFGSAGSGSGQLSLAPVLVDGQGNATGGGSGLAVDESTGDVYVADTANHRVSEFGSDGTFLRAFGADVAGAGIDVCTTACVIGTSASTPGAFEAPTFIAVDNDPASGSFEDVYVADRGDDLVSKFGPEGNLIASWGVGGQLSGSAAEDGPFASIAGIAVDSSGDLFVYDENTERRFEFAPDGTPAPTVTIERSTSPVGIGIDAGGDFYKVLGFGNLIRYEASGTEVGEVDAAQDDLGFAVDQATGDVYIDNRGTSISHLDTTVPGVPQEPAFGSGHLTGASGVAVDSSTNTVYVADTAADDIVAFTPLVVPDATTGPATALTDRGATLNGTVSAAGVAGATCVFQYATESQFQAAGFEGAASAPCVPAGPFSGSTAEAVHAELAGLVGGTTYRFRLLASNANGSNPGAAETFTTLGPTIDATSSSAVSATAATLEAELDPDGLLTTYHFEYDTAPYAPGEGPHGTSTPVASAGSGTEALARAIQIQGLAPLTTYHYRVVAQNSSGTTEGPDRSFTTQGAAASLLPDGRVWELVSPPDKHGIPLESIAAEGGLIQAAADGSGIAYIAKGPTDPEPAGNRSGVYSELLSSRGTGGWSTQDIATAHQAPVGVFPGRPSEYRLFSSDLSLGLVEPFGATPLSPQTTERTPYLRQPDGQYLPLVTAANVPEGVKFGGEESRSELFVNGVEFVTGTPDLSHVLLDSPQDLTAGFSPGFEPSFAEIYEWSAGALRLVSQVPPGAAASCGGPGLGPACLPAAEAGLRAVVGGPEQFLLRHAFSADGSRVVFTTHDSEGKEHLYLRDLGRGETVQLDALEPGCTSCSAVAEVNFQEAAADDSRIFFTTSGRLTADATAGPDLYMCQIVETAGHLTCALTDLTVDHNAGEAADVQGAVIGASEDGSSVYFVANGALTTGEGAVRGDCAVSSSDVGSGECNLYRFDAETGNMHLVAVLSGQDFPDWAGATPRNLGRLTARVSPDGRYLAFMSRRSLTGYDNRDAVSQEPDQEVFLYDAAADGGAGKVVCASCNPTGARPRGVFDPLEFPGRLVDREGINWGEQTLAANIPARRPGLLRSQSGRISRVTARRSCVRSAKVGRPQNQ
jgi:hypothetical protein